MMQVPKTDGRTQNSNAYTLMRADILECRILPGERLRFGDLQKRYEVAVGPLREGLMRLMSDGLVLLEEHKGFRVTDVSPAQLTDIAATRRELEPIAIRWSIERGDDRWEGEVVARFHELAKREVHTGGGELDMEWELRHRAFHASLYSACDSAWTTYFCDLLHDQMGRYRRLWVRHFSKTRDALAEHRHIMEAVLQRDSAAATRLIQQHIDQTAEALIEHMKVHKDPKV